MNDQAEQNEGPGCEKCGSLLRVSDGHLSCSACGNVQGLVTHADRIRAHRAAILADVNYNTKPRRGGSRQTKAQRALERLNNQSLLDPVVRPKSDGRNGLRSSAKSYSALPNRPLRVRLGRTRCIPCDRLLTVHDGKVICASCGVIFADVGILNYLRDELGAVSVDGP